MDTLFVQFYSKHYSQGDQFNLELGNGFSDTYDLCKSKGDFVWIYHDFEDYISEFPINKGTAYISASYTTHLNRVYMWAKNYPNVNFIIGGPIVASKSYKKIGDIPKNFTLIDGSVEKYFGVKDFSGKWKLELPQEIPEDQLITISYTLDNLCYWSKCNFCSLTKSKHNTTLRKRTKFNFEFMDINRVGKINVRLGTEALSPLFIRNILNILPKSNQIKEYRTFIRSTTQEIDALKTVSNSPKNIKFSLGLEYPTQRMWDYMGKGYNKNDVIKIIKAVQEMGLYIRASIMLGWNNLIHQDIKDLEDFFSISPLDVSIFRLFAIPNTEIHRTYERGVTYDFGPFHLGFYPKLSKEQLDLNKEAKRVIVNHLNEKNLRLDDFCDFNL